MRFISALRMASLALPLVGCGDAAEPYLDHASQGQSLSVDHGAAHGAARGAARSAAIEVRLPLALGGGRALVGRAPSTPPRQLHALGAEKSPRGAALADAEAFIETFAPPASADISGGAPWPGDQASTGSCTTWASGYTALGWWANHGGLAGATFAPMYLYSQLVKGSCDKGLAMTAPLSLLKSQGIDTQSDYEPNQYNLDCGTQPTSAQKANAARFKISGYSTSDLKSGPRSAIMSAIAGGKPAIIAMMVYPEFQNADASNYFVGPPVAGDTSPGGHAITAFAYDDNGVWILNSWGVDWGRNGWAQLSWDFVNGSFNGQANVYEVDTINGVSFTCADSGASCAVGSFTGQCQANPSYMLPSCCASCANPAPHFSSSSGWYRIQNVWLGSGYSFDTGVIAATGNYSGQYWKLTPLPGGRYRLTNRYQGDGTSLDTTNSPEYISVMAASGSYSGQFWTLTPITNGVYRLTNDFLGPDRSLAPSSDGYHVGFFDTGRYTGQFWTIAPIP